MTQNQRIQEIERRLESLDLERRDLISELNKLRTKLTPLSELPNIIGTQVGIEAHSPEDKVRLFHPLFVARTSVYPKLWENVLKGIKGYAPTCANEWDRHIDSMKLWLLVVLKSGSKPRMAFTGHSTFCKHSMEFWCFMASRKKLKKHQSMKLKLGRSASRLLLRSFQMKKSSSRKKNYVIARNSTLKRSPKPWESSLLWIMLSWCIRPSSLKWRQKQLTTLGLQ